MSRGAVSSVGTASATDTSPGAFTRRPSSPAIEPVTVSVEETSDSPSSERRVSATLPRWSGSVASSAGSALSAESTTGAARSAAESGIAWSEPAIASMVASVAASASPGRLEARMR
jgi:hypothetical protein